MHLPKVPTGAETAYWNYEEYMRSIQDACGNVFSDSKRSYPDWTQPGPSSNFIRQTRLAWGDENKFETSTFDTFGFGRYTGPINEEVYNLWMEKEKMLDSKIFEK